MKKIILLLCLAAMLYSPMTVEANTLNSVVAVVNGEIITQYDLQAELNSALQVNQIDAKDQKNAPLIAQAQKEILDTIIENKLISFEANKLGIGVSPEELENELSKFIAQSQLSEDEFYKQAQLQGLTKAQLKSRLLNTILQQRLFSQMVERKVVVTKEEIEAYYNEHKSEFLTHGNLNIALIVYPSDIDAKKISDDIKNGKKSFEEVAAKYSIGPNPQAGGNMGYMKLNELNTDLQKIVSSLKKGQVSELFAMQLNMAQLKLIEMSGETDLTNAYASIEQILREPRLQARLEDYLLQLRKKAMVDIRL